MASEEVEVKRDVLLPCMSCLICEKRLREATTIIECLHSFCRKCIYGKLEDEGMKECPECSVCLGGAPLDKLRPDHNLQTLLAKTFPHKKSSVEVNAVEVATPAASLSPKRKEKSRSLSSLAISPAVQTTTEVKGRRTKPAITKNQRGTRFTQKRSMNNDDEFIEYHRGSSTSPETVNKYTRRMRQKPVAGPSVDASPEMERGNDFENSKRQDDALKPSNSAATGLSAHHTSNKAGEANKNRPFRNGTQEPFAKPGALNSQDNEKSASDDAPPETACPKKVRRTRRKSKNFGDIKNPSPQHVVNPSSSNSDRISYPIWFSLEVSNKEEVDSPQLPQIMPNYIRIKDVRMPVSCIQKYLKSKLDLKSENEVEIRCAGQTVDPMQPLDNLLEFWLQTLTTERVSVTIGSSAKDFVMPLHYAPRVQ